MADEKIIATSSEEVTEKADLQTEKKETKKNKPCTRWRHKRIK